MINRTQTFLLLCYISIASSSAAIITPALPAISAQFHIDKGTLAWVVSIFLLGYVIGQLIYGPLANRFGRLPALRIGLSINILGILICLLAVSINSYALLILGRGITALGAAAGLICTFILIRELLDETRAKIAMSYSIVAFSIGIGLAVTIGGLITQYLQWQDCFWLLLIHGIIMLVLTWQFPETLKIPQSLNLLQLWKNYATALKNSTLIIFSLFVGMATVFAYCYSAAAPVYAQTILHLSPSNYSYWNILNMAGMLASGFLSAYLLKRLEAKTVLCISLILLLPCLASLIFIFFSSNPVPIWFFGTTSLLYLFVGLMFPAGAFFATSTSIDKANASSMMSFINMAAAMLAVIIMGYLPLSVLSAFIVTLGGFYLFIVLCFAISFFTF